MTEKWEFQTSYEELLASKNKYPTDVLKRIWTKAFAHKEPAFLKRMFMVLIGKEFGGKDGFPRISEAVEIYKQIAKAYGPADRPGKFRFKSSGLSIRQKSLSDQELEEEFVALKDFYRMYGVPKTHKQAVEKLRNGQSWEIDDEVFRCHGMDPDEPIPPQHARQLVQEFFNDWEIGKPLPYATKPKAEKEKLRVRELEKEAVYA